MRRELWALRISEEGLKLLGCSKEMCWAGIFSRKQKRAMAQKHPYSTAARETNRVARALFLSRIYLLIPELDPKSVSCHMSLRNLLHLTH